ncbi:MAG TPA: RDD family protein [Bacilli bacterium]|jgi:uncharacterized RDD family membrane protein YckC|nr:MAG: RDD family protein [Tenericutes bacterium ADurb.Bin140]HOE78249.1 RDD family protein [Bacilli bacterium]HON64326.1 RDD family protein [Bacilli bacterium]HOR96570.1 RDD family protein [Bacilli bacterium]HPD12790.1 RDD family protein [Bacilli bacterium]
MTLHNFERRLRAFSIDISLAFLLVFCWFILAYNFEEMSNQTKAFIATGIIYLVMIVPHFIKKGQTFGKRTQKMLVVWNDSSDTVPPLWLLILRELFKMTAVFLTFGIYTFVGGIITTNRRDGRTIHDFIFRTKVICLTPTVSGSYINKSTGYVNEQLKGWNSHD